MPFRIVYCAHSLVYVAVSMQRTSPSSLVHRADIVKVPLRRARHKIITGKLETLPELIPDVDKMIMGEYQLTRIGQFRAGNHYFQGILGRSFGLGGGLQVPPAVTFI
jgi:hypothetical protein